MSNNDEEFKKAIEDTFSKLTPEQREAWAKAASKYPPDEEDLRVVTEEILPSIKDNMEKNTNNIDPWPPLQVI